MKYKKYLDKIDRTINVQPPCDTIGKRLHRNERAERFTDDQWRSFVDTLEQEDMVLYQNDYAARKAIADYKGVDPDNVIIFAGADAALKCTIDAFIEPGSTVLVPEYRFNMLDVYVPQNDGCIAELMYDGLELSRHILGNLTDHRLTIVANPNSPVGDILSSPYYEFLESMGVPIIVDSTYEEFGSTPLNVREKIDKDYIFINSFSKAWGGAGMRVGYAIANLEIIRILTKVRPMVPVAGISLKFIQWALANLDIKDAYVKSVIDAREKINAKYPGNIGGSWCHLPMELASSLEAGGFTFKAGTKLPGKSDLIRMGACQNILDYI